MANARQQARAATVGSAWRRALLVLSMLQLALPALCFSAPAPPPATPGSYYSKAAAFYNAWNNRDVEEAIGYFSDQVYFVDAQYSEPFRGSAQVKAYLQECADSLPGWKFIIDDYAEDAERRRVGLKWHVSDTSGIPLPFPTNGLSFLEFDESGRICGCTDMVEPTVKTGVFQLPLLRFVTRVLRIR